MLEQEMFSSSLEVLAVLFNAGTFVSSLKVSFNWSWSSLSVTALFARRRRAVHENSSSVSSCV